MELEPVGRVENPQELDLDPIIVPIVGYTLQREEVIERFSFRPVIPWEQFLDLADAQMTGGGVQAGVLRRFLQDCLLAEDRDRWHEFTRRDDVIVDPSTWAAAYQALMEVYEARPTMPRSASTGGGGKTKRTSRAASQGRARASRASLPR